MAKKNSEYDDKGMLKTKRVPLDTKKFTDCWLKYDKSLSDDQPSLVADFIKLLAKALDLPDEVIKSSSVQAKCYALNNRAKKRGLSKIRVPGSGVSPGSGLPVVDWNNVYKNWPKDRDGKRYPKGDGSV